MCFFTSATRLATISEDNDKCTVNSFCLFSRLRDNVLLCLYISLHLSCKIVRQKFAPIGQYAERRVYTLILNSNSCPVSLPNIKKTGRQLAPTRSRTPRNRVICRVKCNVVSAQQLLLLAGTSHRREEGSQKLLFLFYYTF